MVSWWHHISPWQSRNTIEETAHPVAVSGVGVRGSKREEEGTEKGKEGEEKSRARERDRENKI